MLNIDDDNDSLFSIVSKQVKCEYDSLSKEPFLTLNEQYFEEDDEYYSGCDVQ